MIQNKKAQGFDTFKLLIAAVVAMVILGIITGVFGKIGAIIGGMGCVSQPINEIVSTVQQASSGITKATGMLCLSTAGDKFEKGAIDKQLSGLAIGTISCSSDAKENQICSGSSKHLEVASDSIMALGAAQFKVRVTCTDNSCDLMVINA